MRFYPNEKSFDCFCTSSLILGRLFLVEIIRVLSKEPCVSSIVLLLYIQPGAKKTEVSGEYDERTRIRVKAPPVEGKANEALCEFLTEEFGVRRSEVILRLGEKSRYKTVEILNAKKRPGWY